MGIASWGSNFIINNKTGINNKPPPKPEALDIPAATNIDKKPNKTAPLIGKIESCLQRLFSK